jgi:hypothetical protein
MLRRFLSDPRKIARVMLIGSLIITTASIAYLEDQGFSNDGIISIVLIFSPGLLSILLPFWLIFFPSTKNKKLAEYSWAAYVFYNLLLVGENTNMLSAVDIHIPHDYFLFQITWHLLASLLSIIGYVKTFKGLTSHAG